MDDALRHELSAAQNPEDKAAIIAEVLFSTLPEETATLARRCSLLHWFDEAIFAALAGEIPLSRSETKDFYEQFGHFPMVETLPWGLAFNKLTREGLLRRYTQRQPELLRTAARLAAPAYQARRQDRRALSEAFFCLIVAGNTTSALDLLTELLQQAATRGDWEYIARLLRMQGEAERLPFAQPLSPPIAYQAVRFFAYRVLTQAFTAEKEEQAREAKTAQVRKAQEEAYAAADEPRGLTLSPSQSPQRVSTPPLSRPKSVHQGISRRTIVVGLAAVGLAIAGGSLTWLVSPRIPPTPIIPLGTLLYTYQGHTAGVDAVAWSPDGRRIASSGDDSTVQIFDAADGRHVYIYRGHSHPVWQVAWSPDGRRIASGSIDGTVQVWDAADGRHVYIYRGHSPRVRTVAWSPDGRRIASGGDDQTVQVWDAANGGNVYIYRGHANSVALVAWSPNGRRIASGSDDFTVQVWDAADGGHVFIYRGHHNSAGAVAWSPDGRRIASGSLDKTVQVFDAADGGHVFTYRGHTAEVYSTAWSPDGRRIASGGPDRTVQVWDAANGGNVYIYRGHSDVVHMVAWSPDGTRIASASADETVQVWDAD